MTTLCVACRIARPTKNRSTDGRSRLGTFAPGEAFTVQYDLSARVRARTIGVNGAKYQDFVRAKHGTGIDAANRFLDQGNYLAYGLAASCLWVLGIPFGLAVLHGKTRRGALVFDIADLIKDALILPQAFLSASEGQGGQEFRDSVIELLVHAQALDFLIESVKSLLAGVEAS